MSTGQKPRPSVRGEANDRNYRTGKEYTTERRRVLRALTKKHGLTQEQAGALYGLTKQRVSQIVRGAA